MKRKIKLKNLFSAVHISLFFCIEWRSVRISCRPMKIGTSRRSPSVSSMRTWRKWKSLRSWPDYESTLRKYRRDCQKPQWRSSTTIWKVCLIRLRRLYRHSRTFSNRFDAPFFVFSLSVIQTNSAWLYGAGTRWGWRGGGGGWHGQYYVRSQGTELRDLPTSRDVIFIPCNFFKKIFLLFFLFS